MALAARACSPTIARGPSRCWMPCRFVQLHVFFTREQEAHSQAQRPTSLRRQRDRWTALRRPFLLPPPPPRLQGVEPRVRVHRPQGLVHRLHFPRMLLLLQRRPQGLVHRLAKLNGSQPKGEFVEGGRPRLLDFTSERLREPPSVCTWTRGKLFRGYASWNRPEETVCAFLHNRCRVWRHVSLFVSVRVVRWLNVYSPRMRVEVEEERSLVLGPHARVCVESAARYDFRKVLRVVRAYERDGGRRVLPSDKEERHRKATGLATVRQPQGERDDERDG